MDYGPICGLVLRRTTSPPPKRNEKCGPMCRVPSYGYRMFRCVTTAPQHQTLSVRFCVPFAGRVAGMPRLDYCNATLAGLPASQLSRLQSVLNAATRLIHRSSRYEHVTPMLRDIHWLRSPECIEVSCAHLPMPALPCATSF